MVRTVFNSELFAPAWAKVGIEITVPLVGSFKFGLDVGRGDDEGYSSLKQQIEALSAQVKALAKEIEGQGQKGRK